MKLEKLKDILSSMESVVVAFSGGLDSSFLLKVAKDVLGENVMAVMAVSPVYSDSETNAAKKIANDLDIELKIIETREIDDPKFKSNPKDRCYWCKKELFGKILDIAKKNNFKHVIDGANHDDLGDYRPGSQAARELGVSSPLQEVGFTKDDIRSYSRQLGLSTWDKPSMACLASRFPYGSEITIDKLKRVDKAENILRSLGFKQVRVRHYEDTARIEVNKDEISKLVSIKDEVDVAFKKTGYDYIIVDLEGYRMGSMNENLVLRT